MTGARIAVFEDSPAHRRLINVFAELEGHEVVLSADSLRFALASLEGVVRGDVNVDAYILDANLGAERDGHDARIIAAKMGELGITGLRIGYSGDEYPVPVDFDARKDPRQAIDFITNYGENGRS